MHRHTFHSVVGSEGAEDPPLLRRSPRSTNMLLSLAFRG